MTTEDITMEKLSRDQIHFLYEREGAGPSRYESQLAEYQSYRVEILSNLVQMAVKELTPGNALDIGSGEGVLTSLLRQLGVQVTCLDLSLSYLERVRSRRVGASMIQGDCAALPFASRSFDLILALDIVEHVPLYEQAIRECARVSRKGIVLSTSTDGHHRTLARLVGIDVEAEDLKVGHLHVYKYSKALQIMTRNLEGFVVAEPQSLFVTPHYVHVLTLAHRLPDSWTRLPFRLLNQMANIAPSVFSNWIAFGARRP